MEIVMPDEPNPQPTNTENLSIEQQIAMLKEQHRLSIEAKIEDHRLAIEAAEKEFERKQIEAQNTFTLAQQGKETEFQQQLKSKRNEQYVAVILAFIGSGGLAS